MYEHVVCIVHLYVHRHVYMTSCVSMLVKMYMYIYTSFNYSGNVHASDCGSAHCSGCVVDGISAKTAC